MKTSAIKIAFSIILLNGATTFAQEVPDTVVFNKIKKAELQNSRIPQMAHYLTDVSGPRLTGSPGFEHAAGWVMATMKSWGLSHVAAETWGNFGRPWEIKDFSLFLRLPYPQPLHAYAQPWSANTNGTVRGGVFLITQKEEMDTTFLSRHSAAIQGKFVLIAGDSVNTADSFKPSATRYNDSDLANLKDMDMIPSAMEDTIRDQIKLSSRIDILLKKYGALGIISTSSGSINGSVSVQWFNGYRVPVSETLPKVNIALEDACRLQRLVTSGQKVALSLNLSGVTSAKDVKGYNVIAEIPGSDPKLKAQIVMLGAHLDSWEAATGATDNGAGCLIMMEAVRLIDSLHLKPKRTIRIALWSGEEQGLLGSYGYVKNHFMDPSTYALKAEQSKVSVYFNLDKGTGKIRGIYAQNNSRAKAVFEQWFKPFNSLGAATVTLSSSGSTDHLSFDWAAIPGFNFVQDPIDYETRTVHTNLDDYDHLQMNDLKQAAVIVASFVYQASITTDMIPRKSLVKERFVFGGL